MPRHRILALVPDGALAREEEGGAGAELHVDRVATVSAFLKELPRREWLAVLVSLGAEHVDEALVERIARAPGCGALWLSTPRTSLDTALLAQRVGGQGVLREPVSRRELASRVEPLADEGAIVPFPEPAARASGGDEEIRLVGESAEMAPVFETLARVAPSDATVLLTGESGTGKEVVARVLHEASPRRGGPLVAVNCAAIPEALLETELFGHEKGAFTGAIGSRTGRFERADGGTLFLDEIGDMSLVLQAKVLRALEARRVDPLGGSESRGFDVRVIAATNRDLGQAMREGTFREDLYFRLAVVELALPPLRERQGDIRILTLHLGGILARRHGKSFQGITEGALRRLSEYAWPGNVRELRNVLDRAVVLSVGPVLRSGHLRLDRAAPRHSARLDGTAPAGYPVSFSLDQVETDHINRVLQAHGGHLGEAAEVLGIHRNTLSRKLHEREAPQAGAGTEVTP